MKMKAGFVLVVALLGCLSARIIESRRFQTRKNGPVSESLLTKDTIHVRADDLEYADAQAPIQTTSEVWLWCQLDADNTRFRHFRHFPHASQALLPCWSWFQKIKRERRHRLMTKDTRTNTHCGFYLKDGLGQFVRPNQWIDDLIRHMGCIVTESEPPRSIDSGGCTSKGAENCGARNITLVYRLPKDNFYSLQFFKRPQDAAALRTTILRSLKVKEKQRTSATRIAIVNRKSTRRIMNRKIMVAALRATFPNTTVKTVYMEDMTPEQQFRFWSQQDIVITGHGAAITNAFFLPPRNTSAVIEIFPPHYYPAHYFSSLLESAGIRGYGHFNGVSDYIADNAEHSKTKAERSLYRQQNLKPSVDAVVDLVRQAMLQGVSQ